MSYVKAFEQGRNSAYSDWKCRLPRNATRYAHTLEPAGCEAHIDASAWLAGYRYEWEKQNARCKRPVPFPRIQWVNLNAPPTDGERDKLRAVGKIVGQLLTLVDESDTVADFASASPLGDIVNQAREWEAETLIVLHEAMFPGELLRAETAEKGRAK